MKSKLKAIAHTIASKLKYICKGLFKHLPVYIELLTPYVGMLLVWQAYEQRGCFRVGGEWFVPLLMYIVVYLFRTANKAVSDNLEGLPVARKRFTRRGPNGEAIFNFRDVYEMGEYLAEVEDYCEQYGKYRGKKQ